MILFIIVVRDRAADAYGQPQYQTSVGGAIRNFSDAINRPGEGGNNVMHEHPEDFDLFELGTYDDSSAEFKLLPQPRQIAIGKDCVVKK